MPRPARRNRRSRWRPPTRNNRAQAEQREHIDVHQEWVAGYGEHGRNRVERKDQIGRLDHDERNEQRRRQQPPASRTRKPSKRCD